MIVEVLFSKPVVVEVAMNSSAAGGGLPIPGPKGADGLSAYEVALLNGFSGTVRQWLDSLKGAKGDSSKVEIRNGSWYINGVDSGVKAKGEDGKSIELQKGATYVQWRVVGASTWNNLIPVADLTGANGRSVELQVGSGNIQWRLAGDSSWINLLSVSSLKGADGSTPSIGANGNWFVGTTDTGVKAAGSSGVDGKSAYQSALSGGMSAAISEAQFNANLADLPNKQSKDLTQNRILIGNSSNKASEAEIYDEFINDIPLIPGQRFDTGLATLTRTGSGKLVSQRQIFISNLLTFSKSNGASYTLVSAQPSTVKVHFISLGLLVTGNVSFNPSETISLELYIGTTLFAQHTMQLDAVVLNDYRYFQIVLNYNQAIAVPSAISLKVVGVSANANHIMQGYVVIDSYVLPM